MRGPVSDGTSLCDEPWFAEVPLGFDPKTGAGPAWSELLASAAQLAQIWRRKSGHWKAGKRKVG